MVLIFSNTLSGKKEEFKPLNKDLVGLYNCGPTVYQDSHLGNLRAYIFSDLLRRTLEYNNYQVKQVINITDVGHLVGDGDDGEDKIEKATREEKKTAQEISEHYTKKFFGSLRDLNIKTEKTEFPRATAHIPEQIELIKKLEWQGYTYKISDGIYFDTSKFKEYGKLGKINTKGLQEGARVEKNNEKKNITDFALWKFSPSIGSGQSQRQQEWESPWGIGFPGWHIECSAMSMKYLGESFDIHTGGIDHIPIHHNNEIAQSECATKKPLVNYWLHSAHLNIDGHKIAKSIGNTIYLNDLVDKGVSPLAYRFWVLMAHYQTLINFNWEAIKGAQNALERLYNLFRDLGQEIGEIDQNYQEKFKIIINDDLNTPSALTVLWEVIKNEKLSAKIKKATILDFDRVLGIGFDKLKPIEFSSQVENLIKKREEARQSNNWNQADKIRKEILELGYEVEDTFEGPKISKSNN